jgi:hypothetical protein
MSHAAIGDQRGIVVLPTTIKKDSMNDTLWFACLCRQSPSPPPRSFLQGHPSRKCTADQLWNTLQHLNLPFVNPTPNKTIGGCLVTGNGADCTMAHPGYTKAYPFPPPSQFTRGSTSKFQMAPESLPEVDMHLGWDELCYSGVWSWTQWNLITNRTLTMSQASQFPPRQLEDPNKSSINREP